MNETKREVPPNPYFLKDDGTPRKPIPGEQRPRYGDPDCLHLIRCWGTKKCAACGWAPPKR